jgi:cbb3-type cytochrome oxidase maturation protein
MESLYFLIPVALIILLVAIKVLFWAVKSGQYDDLDTEAHRILFDKDPVPPAKNTQPKNSQLKDSQSSDDKSGES